MASPITWRNIEVRNQDSPGRLMGDAQSSLTAGFQGLSNMLNTARGNMHTRNEQDFRNQLGSLISPDSVQSGGVDPEAIAALQQQFQGRVSGDTLRTAPDTALQSARERLLGEQSFTDSQDARRQQQQATELLRNTVTGFRDQRDQAVQGFHQALQEHGIQTDQYGFPIISGDTPEEQLRQRELVNQLTSDYLSGVPNTSQVQHGFIRNLLSTVDPEQMGTYTDLFQQAMGGMNSLSPDMQRQRDEQIAQVQSNYEAEMAKDPLAEGVHDPESAVVSIVDEFFSSDPDLDGLVIPVLGDWEKPTRRDIIATAHSLLSSGIEVGGQRFDVTPGMIKMALRAEGEDAKGKTIEDRIRQYMTDKSGNVTPEFSRRYERAMNLRQGIQSDLAAINQRYLAQSGDPYQALYNWGDASQRRVAELQRQMEAALLRQQEEERATARQRGQNQGVPYRTPETDENISGGRAGWRQGAGASEVADLDVLLNNLRQAREENRDPRPILMRLFDLQ